MPFNPDFAKELEKASMEALAQTGCFNWHCRKPNPTKRCSKCGVAVYCSKQCQIKDWKDVHDPHKTICNAYCANTSAAEWKGTKGQEFPAFIGLASIGLLLEKDLFLMMKRRADVFLKELKRIDDIAAKNSARKYTSSIGITANVVYNFHKHILQCSVNFFDSEVEYGPHKLSKPECVHYIVFEPIGEGGEDVQRRLHPGFGPGDISPASRKRVVKKLNEFLRKVNEHGLFINTCTYQRGLMWMSDEGFLDGGAKKLEEANGGNSIMWMPDQGYAMESAFEAASGAAMKAAFGL